MKTKEEIVQNWLPRYTGRPLDQFTKHILLTNFQLYVDMFAKAIQGTSPEESLAWATGELKKIYGA